MIAGSETMTDINISDPILRYWRAWLEGLPGLDDVTVRENENGWGLYLMLDPRDPHFIESLSEIEDVISTPARTLYGRTEGRKCLIGYTVIGDDAGCVPSYELRVAVISPREEISDEEEGDL